ncbi:hypothetical protein RA277_27955, partial [Pseudomonas syringae pv. tagetis]
FMEFVGDSRFLGFQAPLVKDLLSRALLDILGVCGCFFLLFGFYVLLCGVVFVWGCLVGVFVVGWVGGVVVVWLCVVGGGLLGLWGGGGLVWVGLWFFCLGFPGSGRCLLGGLGCGFGVVVVWLVGGFGVVEGAGGEVVQLDGKTFSYPARESLLN